MNAFINALPTFKGSRVLSSLMCLVRCIYASAGIPANEPGAVSEFPVWAVSFNLGILDQHVETNNIVKRCELLFPTNAAVDPSTFEVLTLQWEKEGPAGFWFEKQASDSRTNVLIEI